MKFGNLKIGTRLGAGFGLLVIFLLAVTFTAVTRINSINATTEKILKDRYAKVAVATQINSAINVQARLVRTAIIGAHNPEEVKASLARIEEASKKNKELFPKLEGMLNTPKGKEFYKAIADAQASYGKARNAIIKLLQDGKAEEAGAYVLTELRGPQGKYFKALDDMVQYQQEQMEKDGEQAAAEGRLAITFTLVIAVLATVAAIVIGWLISRSITRPLETAVRIAQTVAAGDLTSRIEIKSTDETGQLLQALKDMNDSLVGIVGEVRSGTETISTASSQIASGNLDLSSRTEQQASSLEETASSMEELTSTVKQNADNARQANQLAVSASEVASKGGQVVSQVVETMGSINDSSKKIVDIIGVIDGIAFQTNILALNAAVEAARAGEQGRGFAVVASEVRSLAQRSASAAKEIKALIDDSVGKVDAGSKLVDQAGATMEEIVQSIQRVTDIMSEISAATAEQTTGIEQINQAITEMDNVTQQNAALVEEASAAAQAMQDQAGSLAQAVSVFKLDGRLAAAAPRMPTATVRSPKPSALPPIRKAAPTLARSGNVPAPRIASAAKEDDWEEF